MLNGIDTTYLYNEQYKPCPKKGLFCLLVHGLRTHAAERPKKDEKKQSIYEVLLQSECQRQYDRQYYLYNEQYKPCPKKGLFCLLVHGLRTHAAERPKKDEKKQSIYEVLLQSECQRQYEKVL